MGAIKSVRKRDGRVVPYDREKIAFAIFKALQSTGQGKKEKADELALKVEEEIIKRYGQEMPDVEGIQDLVEKVLIDSDLVETARAYILYRKERAEIRKAKEVLTGVKDELKLSLNALKVLERRYLRKDEYGRPIETPLEMFERVARNIAEAEKNYGKDPEDAYKKFFELMTSLKFLPNSPTLMNAGTELQQLAACFVLPVGDSIEEIFDAVKYTALIHKTGGGTGFSFTHLRPKNDVVKSTGGIASGPLSFMRVFDVATDIIKQGGKRRGANMGILRYDHPDIFDFITAKSTEGILSNFNISVAITEEFMKAVENDEEIDLINPRDGKPVRRVKARVIFDLLVYNAWKSGDPGIIFVDRLDRDNPTPHIGHIESTNPCGEQPLLPYEACNLGSINLSKFVKDGKIDYEHLKEVVYTAVHFLDNVIDMSRYPLEQIDRMVRGNRKIGLGVMGFADMLIQLGIPYNSDEALQKAEEIMSFISKTAKEKSRQLAEERGAFPNFKGSVFDQRGDPPIRNATLTTIAPTGTISIIGGCSSGIEPLFAVVYIRNVMEGAELLEVNPYFERTAKEQGFYSEELMREVARTGSVQHVRGIPEKVKRLFVTAHDIHPEWHVRMQAAFQKHVDNAVSKTVNLPYHATPRDVEMIYMLGYKLGVKGITVYRDGSKSEQVIYIGDSRNRSKTTPPSVDLNLGNGFLNVDSEYSGGCETCTI